MIPEHVSAAINQAHAGPRELVREDQPVSPGDIRRVSAGSLDRLVLVLKVSAKSNTSQFTLIHSYSEFATEHDIVIEPVATGLPYEIVVQTDLRAVVSTAELDELVAVVPTRVVLACFEGPANLAEDYSMFVGPPMLGPLDARWDFKVEEGETIREISSATIVSFFDESGSGQLEFDRLLSVLLPHSENPSEMALQTFELWISGDVQFTVEHLELFAERNLLNSTIWENALGVAGEQFFKTVIVPAHDKLISGSTVSLLDRGLLELQFS